MVVVVVVNRKLQIIVECRWPAPRPAALEADDHGVCGVGAVSVQVTGGLKIAARSGEMLRNPRVSPRGRRQ